MMTELTILACLLTGLMSTFHCLGMCGGITTMLALKTTQDNNKQARLANVLTYNLGRIFSYGMIGLLAGVISQFSVNQVFIQSGHLYLQIFSSLILIMIALHLLRWLPALTLLEKISLYLWRPIQKLFQWLLPAHSKLEIFTLGLIWGWLPCGLVYSILLLALSSGDPVKSFFYMIAFGLGTLPGMLSASLGSSFLNNKLKANKLRTLSATIIIIIALITPFSYLLMGQHHGHSHHHSSHHHHLLIPETMVNPDHHIAHY